MWGALSNPQWLKQRLEGFQNPGLSGNVSAILEYCIARYASTDHAFCRWKRFDFPNRKSGVPLIFFRKRVLPIPINVVKHLWDMDFPRTRCSIGPTLCAELEDVSNEVVNWAALGKIYGQLYLAGMLNTTVTLWTPKKCWDHCGMKPTWSSSMPAWLGPKNKKKQTFDG